MIRSIQAAATDFRFALSEPISHICGNMIQEINTSSSQVKQTAKIVVIIALAALAVIAIIWLAGCCCCFKANKPNDPPKSPPPPPKNNTPPNSPPPNSDPKAMAEARKPKFESLETACVALAQIEKKSGHEMTTQRLNLLQAVHSAFSNDIGKLKSFDEDYQKYEAYANRLYEMWQPYYEVMVKKSAHILPHADFEGYFFITKVYEKGLDDIYVRLAEKYYTLGEKDQCLLMASRVKFNETAAQEMILAVARDYLQEDEYHKALDIFKTTKPSSFRDDLCKYYIQRLIDDGHYDQAEGMLLIIAWNDPEIQEKLKVALANKKSV